ncbi:hypothetical protein DFH27DRAFT_604391 [Peziza echinospora]|nr:hypothetical protein DFH27DRAFT_604391 [Peziza echinospora]
MTTVILPADVEWMLGTLHDWYFPVDALGLSLENMLRTDRVQSPLIVLHTTSTTSAQLGQIAAAVRERAGHLRALEIAGPSRETMCALNKIINHPQPRYVGGVGIDGGLFKGYPPELGGFCHHDFQHYRFKYTLSGSATFGDFRMRPTSKATGLLQATKGCPVDMAILCFGFEDNEATFERCGDDAGGPAVLAVVPMTAAVPHVVCEVGHSHPYRSLLTDWEDWPPVVMRTHPAVRDYAHQLFHATVIVMVTVIVIIIIIILSSSILAVHPRLQPLPHHQQLQRCQPRDRPRRLPDPHDRLPQALHIRPRHELRRPAFPRIALLYNDYMSPRVAVPDLPHGHWA